MNFYDSNTQNIQWPEPTGMLSQIKNISAPYRTWQNIGINEAVNLIGACLHDLDSDYDTIYFLIRFNETYSQFKIIELVSYGRCLSHFKSYEFDEIYEFIEREVKTHNVTNGIYKIACQLTGDLWLAQE